MAEDKGPPYTDDESHGNTMIQTRAVNATGAKREMQQTNQILGAQQTQDNNQARSLHERLAKGEELSSEEHQWLSGYHSARGEKEGEYDGLDKD